LKVALLGFGTVGRSVAKLLCQDTDHFRLICILNRNLEHRKVDWLPTHVRWAESMDEVTSYDVDVVVELIGGLEPAGQWVRRALKSGKSVVTANKHLIAEQGSELTELARQHGQRIGFGASVAGGIPVLVGLEEGLAGDRLHRIVGILNGTCNYILSRMESTGVPFSQALREAQDLGFAEADPREDVEGFDARAKLVILTRVGLGCQIRSEQVLCRSISAIEAVDFAYARELDCTIRQIALAERDPAGSRLFASVQPALVPKSSLLAHVHGNQNLVLVAGQYAGETAFSGCGAGGDPTAVAVISDLLSIARDRRAKPWPARAKECRVSEDFTAPYYARFVVRDCPGIIAAVAAIFARHGINIDAVLQKPGYPPSRLPFVITLEPSTTVAVNRALEEIRELDFHVQPPVWMPIFLR